MVSELNHEGKLVYVCEVCKFGYVDKASAIVCENFCRAHNACSMEITRRAIYKPN